MTNVDELKAKELEILKELDRVCRKANVKYYLAYGTCLGAVRHKGFIPWDDDIDVVITWTEMQKLLDNADLFSEKYFLQGNETEPTYRCLKYSLRDSSTAYFGSADDSLDMNHGIYIDIYVMYPYPDNFFKGHKLIIDVLIMNLLYMRGEPLHHGMAGRLASRIVKRLYRGDRKERKIKKVENALRTNGGKKYCSCYFGNDITPFSCIKFPVGLFQEPEYLQFEDFYAPCPSDPGAFCELSYGKTYMEPPPESERESVHHYVFMSCDEPYTKFKGKYYNVKE